MTFDPRDWQHPADTLVDLEHQLFQLITRAWQRGWMPADLIATVAHGRPARVAKLLGRLIVAEHLANGYGDRVTPRWHSQMTAIREGEPTKNPLTQPGPTVKATSLQRDATDLHLSLSFLPELRRLGPLPGDATLGTVRAAPGSPPTESSDAPDPDLLQRVRALLAKAESTDFDAEAEAFTAKAQTLIATHSLDDALRSTQTDGGGPDAIRLAIERPYDREKFGLLGAVARANRCRSILHQGLGLATIIGFTVDLQAVELLYTSLLVQATRSMQAHGRTNDGYGTSTTRSFRKSFLVGFAGRIGERLRSETERATESAEAEAGSRLAPVLASRAAHVDRAVEEAFPRLSRPRSSRAQVDFSGWSAGVRAADQAKLKASRPIAS